MGAFLFLVACGGVISTKDSAPKSPPDVSNVPNAVPKDEPRSKYGNPAHYEVFGKRYYTLKSGRGYQKKGIASWYGKKFHGKRTSSGEPYDMYAMTAAHKTLPLPTYVEVTNLKNGKKVIVKVNDRGPFHENRLIDLSYSAAKQLGIIATGTGMVNIRTVSAGYQQSAASEVEYQPANQKVVKVKTPKSSAISGLYLQVGAFGSEKSAVKVKVKLQRQIDDAILIMPIIKSTGKLYRVRVGPLANVEYADTLASRLFDLGYNDSHIVVE